MAIFSERLLGRSERIKESYPALDNENSTLIGHLSNSWIISMFLYVKRDISNNCRTSEIRLDTSASPVNNAWFDVVLEVMFVFSRWDQ